MDDLTFYEDVTVDWNETATMDRMQISERVRSSKDFLWAIEQAKELINPRGIVGIASVTKITDNTVKIGDQKFTSRILRVNIDSCDVVYPFLATIGPELESIASEQTSLTKKFFLELMGDYALTNAMWNIEGKIKKKYSIKRSSTMTPGSLDDWPITQQVPFFNLFGKDLNRVGVELTSSMLMKPRKSLSGIVFQSENVFINCQLCQRDRCPGRRAKYLAEKFAGYGLPIPPAGKR